jgi:hypothetical protein
VLRDIFKSRAISLIDFPLIKCSRRIRPIVSTISIPHRPLQTKAGSPAGQNQGGQFWTPIPHLRGQSCTPKHKLPDIRNLKEGTGALTACDFLSLRH